ncbi:DUF922 domain-containing protein [Salinimicrobium sp. CAU 1759]
MKKAILSSLFLLLISFGAQAQLDEERVGWKDNALTWKDFKATPDPTSPFSANTASGISYGWSMKGSATGKEYSYEVSSFFIPGKSWVKDGSASPNLLAHEQLHFDITELFARKLRKALAEFDFDNSRNLKADLQALYKNAEQERALMQQQFDVETRHSMNEAAQLEWQKYIKEELRKLEKFSS